MGATCLALTVLCAAALGTQEKETPGPWMELPDDPVGRLWASVGDTVEPWMAPGPMSASGAEAAPKLTWEHWTQSLSVLTPLAPATPAPSPGQAERRGASAFLMQFALENGRAEDAFRWLQALGADDPAALAGLLPTLFPGVPAGTQILAGGHIAPLPDGVFLRPQLPPVPHSSAARRFSRRSTCLGLRIGEATVDLVLKLDGSGVVAEFIHRGGPAVTLTVQLPAPDGKRLKSLYVDWDLQTPPEGTDEATFDWSTTPIQFTIQPQPTGPDAPSYDESFSVFARLALIDGGVPTAPKGELPHAMLEGGLDLLVGPTLAGLAPTVPWSDEPWSNLAQAWQGAAGIPINIVSTGPTADPSSTSSTPSIRGTAIRFHGAPNQRRLARQITSAIEGRRRQDHLLYR